MEIILYQINKRMVRKKTILPCILHTLNKTLLFLNYLSEHLNTKKQNLEAYHRGVKNVHIDKFDKIFDEYNNTYYRTIRMFLNVESSGYIDCDI